MKNVTEKLTWFLWWNSSLSKNVVEWSSEELVDNFSTGGIMSFDFTENVSLSQARSQIIEFANNLSLSSIRDMSDFRLLQMVVKQMSDYLLKNQYGIKKLPVGWIQDFKISFREIQEKIRRMSQDDKFIKKLTTNNGVILEDEKIEKTCKKEINRFYESLVITYNAVVAAFRVDSYIPIPEEMKLMESFPESFEMEWLAKSKTKFTEVLKDIKSMSDYILDNEDDIWQFPAMQLFDFKNTLEWVIAEVRFMLDSEIFAQPQLFNLEKINEPDSKLHRAYDTVNQKLKFDEELSLERAVDLISTFWHRMNSEELSQNIEKFWEFLQELKSMSRYMIMYKVDIKDLPDTVLKELKKW